MASPRGLWRGIGCPNCTSFKGEKRLYSYLAESKINYIPQYSFDDLKGFYNYPLRFDCAVFYKDNLFCLIEIDGIGHRKPIRFNGMSDEQAVNSYNLIKAYDEIKNKYCQTRNINLIRIDHDGRDLNKITKILESELSPLLKGGNI